MTERICYKTTHCMSQKNPAISRGVDWLMIWLYIALVAIGIVSIFSVTYREGESVIDGFLKLRTDYGKQFFFFILSLIIGLTILLTDSKFFTATANIWYALGIFLLLLVFPFHTEVKGTESIIRFGSSFQIQPAEICKIFVALALAKYLSRVETEFTRPRSQLDCCGDCATSGANYNCAERNGSCTCVLCFLSCDVPRRLACNISHCRIFVCCARCSNVAC